MIAKNTFLPIKINHDISDVCFWGCLHYGHKCEHWETPLWKIRGFDSPDSHDSHIERELCTTLKPSSLLFLLGDNAFGYESEQRLMSLLARAKFKECYIMPGNHVSGWKQIFDKTPVDDPSFQIPCQGKTIHFVPNYLELVFEKQFVVLSHFPILSFVKQGKGGIHLYSHVHGNLEKDPVWRHYKDAPALEVSVEKFLSPVSLRRANLLLRDKLYKTFDHHSKLTKD